MGTPKKAFNKKDRATLEGSLSEGSLFLYRKLQYYLKGVVTQKAFKTTLIPLFLYILL